MNYQGCERLYSWSIATSFVQILIIFQDGKCAIKFDFNSFKSEDDSESIPRSSSESDSEGKKF